MTGSRIVCRRRGARGSAVAALAILAVFAFEAPAVAEDAVAHSRSLVDIAVDEARILRLNQSPASVIIGNPLIADVVVEENGLMILVGRTYGTTNLIALDQRGEELAHLDLVVRSSGTNSLSLYRGTGRFSYNCTPRCEAELDVGDAVEHFQAIQGQISGKTGASMEQAGSGEQ